MSLIELFNVNEVGTLDIILGALFVTLVIFILTFAILLLFKASEKDKKEHIIYKG